MLFHSANFAEEKLKQNANLQMTIRKKIIDNHQ